MDNKSIKLTVFFTILFFLMLIISARNWVAVLFWGLFVFLILISSKISFLHSIRVDQFGVKEKVIVVINIVLISALCIVPMKLSPRWNGEIPEYTDQYERLADAILDGHLYIEYDDYDVRLEQMDNPYDTEARIAEDISYHWDHAFYNGHYYMYFGVVPVLLLFIPFKLVSGYSLVTFHATQFFVLLSIIGMFLLLYMLAIKFFPGISLGTYLFTASAGCCISFGYCTQAPALYCTAISSGFCFMLWSIICYFYAVYIESKESKQLLLAIVGALFGALTFGCRPPIGIANICAIPLAITYSQKYRGKHIVRNYVLIALPYIIVGILLMLYNYARFDNPLEFGQAYQLTASDQTSYSNFFERLNLVKQINDGFRNFFELGEVTAEFPFFNYGGYLVTYPLIWLLIPYVFKEGIIKQLKEDGILLFVAFAIATILIISFAAIQWSPEICERYRLDGYYLLVILTYICIGNRLKTTQYSKNVTQLVCLVSIFSIFLSFLLFMRPNDKNFAQLFPEEAAQIAELLLLKHNDFMKYW